MRRRWILALVLAGVLGGAGPAAAGPGDVPQIDNGPTPAEGLRVVRLEERWRVGADNEEVMLGAPGAVVADPGGNFLVLDRQLSQVQVFSPDGRFQRSVGREGEGPGEMRRPRELFLFPDGSLGVVQTSPAKILRFAPDGTPRESVIPGGQGTQGSLSFLFTGACRNGRLLVTGETMLPGEEAIVHDRYLSRINDDGSEAVRYLTSRITRGRAGFKWDEAEDYFVHFGGFALAPDGRVYAAPIRDRYAIQVFSPEGRLERVITRDFTPHHRSDAEKEEVNASRHMIVNGREIDKVISDRDPAIDRLRVDDAGNLWVLPKGPNPGAPPDAFETWDVFDPSGRFVRQVAFFCPGKPPEDRLFLVGDDRAVLVRGFRSVGVAVLAGTGGGGGMPPATSRAGAADEEEADLELIGYRVPA